MERRFDARAIKEDRQNLTAAGQDSDLIFKGCPVHAGRLLC